MNIRLSNVKTNAQKFILCLLKDKIFLALALSFLATTAIMIYSSAQFCTISGLDHPQFEEVDQLETIYSQVVSAKDAADISSSKVLYYYELFFAIDFIWAFLLLWLLSKLMWSIGKEVDYDRRGLFKCLWVISALIAYSFDIWENLSYLFFHEQQMMEKIVGIKMIGYAFAIVLPFISHVFHSNKKYLEAIVRFLRSSYISLLIIAFIGGLMTVIPQGGTIVIDLLERPWNIIGAFILINFLAVLVSHYPTYFEFKNDNSLRNDFEFTMSNNFWGFGLITYYRTGRNKVNLDKIKIDTLRRSLGILLLCTWLIALLYPIQSYLYPCINSTFIFFLSLVLFVYYHHHRYGQKKELSNKMQKFEHDKTEEKFYAAYNSVQDFVGTYFTIGILFILIGLLFISLAFTGGWHLNLNAYAAIFVVVNIFFFIEFRICRSLLQYIYWNEDNYSAFLKKTLEPSQVQAMGHIKEVKWGKFDNFQQAFYECGLFQPTKKNWFYLWFARWSDNVYYLKGLRWAGLATLVFFVVSNVFINITANHFNAINIVCAFLILMYSLIAISIKHWVYYRVKPLNTNGLLSKNIYKNISVNWDKYYLRFTKVFPLLLIVILAVLTLIRPYTNKIHSLDIIDEDEQCIVAHEQYFNDFTKRNPSKGSAVLSIASDGGGLKANLFNMLALHQLVEENKDTLSAVLTMSGVSGGSLGLGNYWVLHNRTRNVEEKERLILKVGNANILAIDAAGMFMRDFVLSFTGKCNDDRSHFGMNHYAKTLGMEEDVFREQSFRCYWAKLYKESPIPLLNINTSSTSHRQGYALSVSHPKNSLPSSIDILNIKEGKSISYYNAVGTSNRFPFASPAARIKGKGYFVDGGYFENSGILAAQNIFKMGQTIEVFDTMNYKHVIVNIRNGKGDWVRQFVKEFEKRNGELLHSIKKTEEIGAIIHTLINIDKHPESLRGQLENNSQDSIVYIMLPHIISLGDIRNEIGGKIKISRKLMKAIEENNRIIRNELSQSDNQYNYEKWGVVTPPLARLLADPAVLYEKVMVESGLCDWETFRGRIFED